MSLVLASASPRRSALLLRAGIVHEVIPADVDESLLAGEAPERYAGRLAAAKARAVARRLPDRWVLGADTIVVARGDVLGKPADAAEAEAMLRRLSDATHRVTTAVCLVGPRDVEDPFSVTSLVTFRSVLPEEIAGYVECGEWRGKAGGYAVQGIASAFVSRVEGSYTNVVGLPLSEVVEALRARGAARADLARGRSA